jgi:alkanesulfonate monooxygenase SsuD/methylene tetrahydromethanopterin reductase-like flavin-dependent oxidoreductase (luciferase family)
MTRFGYTLMTEQSGPKELVGYAVDAERAGFDFEVMSDHYSPWLASQGHSPYAWSVLGAVAHATERVGLATYVTCPTMRYHPAVVAQKAATVQLLADGRFTLGLGAGENLNEHVVGERWPGVDERHDMLEEAALIIRELLTGELVTWEGEHFRVESARLWDAPDGGVPIGIAVSGEKSLERFAPIAHDQFRWFGGAWRVNSDLPTPAGFTQATQYVRPEDVAQSIACGPDLDALAESVRPFLDAGFTDIALVQVGDRHQQRFLDEVAEPLLERLRALG